MPPVPRGCHHSREHRHRIYILFSTGLFDEPEQKENRNIPLTRRFFDWADFQAHFTFQHRGSRAFKEFISSWCLHFRRLRRAPGSISVWFGTGRTEPLNPALVGLGALFVSCPLVLHNSQISSQQPGKWMSSGFYFFFFLHPFPLWSPPHLPCDFLWSVIGSKRSRRERKSSPSINAKNI